MALSNSIRILKLLNISKVSKRIKKRNGEWQNMRSIKLQNQFIVPAFNFLDEVALKRNASRGRTQLLKRLEEKNKDFNDDLKEIRKEYFVTDDEGELKVVDGQYIPKDKSTKKSKEMAEKIKELNEEVVEIHFGEYSTKYESLFKALDTEDDESEKLRGQNALGYEELMAAYEESNEV